MSDLNSTVCEASMAKRNTLKKNGDGDGGFQPTTKDKTRAGTVFYKISVCIISYNCAHPNSLPIFSVTNDINKTLGTN